MGPVPVNANHAGRSDCKLEGFSTRRRDFTEGLKHIILRRYLLNPKP